MITFDFTDKVALVTGASSGIGFRIARQFLESGAMVMLNGIGRKKLDSALDRLGPLREKAAGFEADVRRKDQVDAMFDALLARWGRIDILVNCAGIYPSVQLTEMPEEQWDAVLDVNLKGPFLTSQRAAREMIARGQGGKMVNISSGSWKNARVGSGAYCASKAGLVMLTAVFAQELGPHKINVNSVAPGLIEVEWETTTDQTRAYHQATVRQTPWGRIGKPEDIANMVLMLCSPESDFVTGTVVSVDGGLLAGRYGIPVSE